jgi:hypothetical protein
MQENSGQVIRLLNSPIGERFGTDLYRTASSLGFPNACPIVTLFGLFNLVLNTNTPATSFK